MLTLHYYYCCHPVALSTIFFFEWIYIFFYSIWSAIYNLLAVDFLYILLLFFFFSYYCLQNILLLKNVYFHIYAFKFASIKYHQCTLLNVAPINCDILRWRNTLLYMDVIWTGFCFDYFYFLFSLHNFLSILPISAFNSPYITFLLYLGANTYDIDTYDECSRRISFFILLLTF